MPNNAMEHATMDLVNISRKRFFITVVVGLLSSIIAIIVTLHAPDTGLWEILSTLLMAVGGTLITAATLGYILNDKGYQSLLKQQMVEVILSPESYRSLEQKIKLWRRVSESLLETVLPFNNRTAVDQIEKLLLDDERQYHFEGYKSEFEFSVDETNDSFTVVQTVTCNLVISLDCSEPILHQWIRIGDDGDISADYLRLNDEDIDFKKEFKQSKDEPNLYIMDKSLKGYLNGEDDSRTLKYERRTVTRESLSKQPYYCMDLTRYAKGLTVEANVSEAYDVEVLGFGCSNPDFPEPEPVEGKPGLKRWRFRDHKDLLLPGFSYMLLLKKTRQ